MNKRWLLLALCIVSALLLAGCASNADTLPSPSPMVSVSPGVTNDMLTSPGPSASIMPGASVSPGIDTLPAAGLTTLEAAQKASKDIEDAIEKLTEVDEAYVVAVNDTAIVGLKLNAQYKGTVDDRLKKMVLTRAQTVTKGVTGVAVTNDPTLMTSIEQLAKSLADSTSLAAITAQVDEMAQQITVYKE